MTIRRQIFLSVALLFIGVGAVGGAVARWLEAGVIQRAFGDQARALTVTVAEFIEPGDVAALRSGAPLAKTRLGPVWSRLERWAIVKRIFLLDPVSGRLLGDTAPPGTPAPGRDAIAKLGIGEVRSLPLRPLGGGRSLLPLAAAAAGGAAVVGVEISPNDYLRERAAMVHDVKSDALLGVLAGLAVAAGLSWLVSRPIIRLGRTVDKIGAPSFSGEETDSAIQEVADLGNTFGVMHNVLEETQEKGRRALLESDAYRSESDLAAIYRRQFQAAGSWSGGRAEAAWFSAGSPPPAFLAGAAELGPVGGAAFAGVAGPDAAGELAAAVRARAAARFLADALARRPLAEAAAEARALFGLDRLVAARWQGRTLEPWSGEGGPSSIPPDPAAWAAGASAELACLGPANRERLALYLKNFPAHALERLPTELPPLLDPAEPGVALVLRRTPIS